MLINIIIILSLIGAMEGTGIAMAQEPIEDPGNIEISEISQDIYHSFPGESQHDMIKRLFGWDLRILQDGNRSKVLRLV